VYFEMKKCGLLHQVVYVPKQVKPIKFSLKVSPDQGSEPEQVFLFMFGSDILSKNMFMIGSEICSDRWIFLMYFIWLRVLLHGWSTQKKKYTFLIAFFNAYILLWKAHSICSFVIHFFLLHTFLQILKFARLRIFHSMK
jgi:hypothetical protein